MFSHTKGRAIAEAVYEIDGLHPGSQDGRVVVIRMMSIPFGLGDVLFRRLPKGLATHQSSRGEGEEGGFVDFIGGSVAEDVNQA